MNVFFVYLDWTTETVPRCFYVGKGKIKRVRHRDRNPYWMNIAVKYGWRREVVFATKDDKSARELERELIAHHKTFEDGSPDRWGANLNDGGDGCSGRHVNVGDANASKRLEVRSKIRQTLLERRPLVGVRKANKDVEKRSKITRQQANEIKTRYAAGGITQRELAREHGLAKCTICNIIAGRKWKDD